MRHFLYLDTDIVNSIIAQQGRGLIDAVTTEKESGVEKGRNRTVSAEVGGEANFSVWKLANAEAQLSITGLREGTNSKHDTTREIIAKTLHDAAFDIAYEAINPKTVQPCCDIANPGEYVEMSRVFDFVDLNYLEGLFSKEGIVDLLVKSEAEKIKKEVDAFKENSMNREQQRQGPGKYADQKAKEYLHQRNKQYNDIYELLDAMGKIIPFSRMLVSYDGYLVPTDENYYRVNPSTLGFMYGGEIKCVGMITNVIGKDTDPNEPGNIFASLRFAVNEALRRILPTKEENIYVVSPIAIYYET
jgi:hypothetical protein